MTEIPQRLIDEIRVGNCVAFVGAGFSAPALPQWSELLLGLAEVDEASPELRARVRRLLERGQSKHLEAAAQTLRDELGPEVFAEHLTASVGNPPSNARMEHRTHLLSGIPFRAVLTTNFDGLLPGRTPGRDAYLEVLRPGDRQWWSERHWAGDSASRVVQLHGNTSDPDSVVFTRRDYRDRLYGTPGYVTFLRSVMATTTVLYLGFSFTDAYLDELRSEILALIDYRGGDHPIAYAVLNDVTDDEIQYARSHEGIEVLGYPSDDDFIGFDHLLEELHTRTDPSHLLGELIHGRRIVWIDPAAEAVDFGMRFLTAAAEEAGGGTVLDRFDDADAGLAAGAEGADLIITRWGHGQRAEGSTAEYVLGQIRERNILCPAVVFASGDYADENRPKALRLGATAYESTWEGLFREIERLMR